MEWRRCLTFGVHTPAISPQSIHKLRCVRLVDVEAREHLACLANALLDSDVRDDLDIPAQCPELLLSARSGDVLRLAIVWQEELSVIELQVDQLLVIARDEAHPVFDVPNDSNL